MYIYRPAYTRQHVASTKFATTSYNGPKKQSGKKQKCTLPLTVKCCTQSNPISRTWGHLRNKFLQLKFLHAIPEIRTHGQFNCPTYVLKRREVPLYWWRLRLILVVQFLYGDASFTRNPSALTRKLVWQSYRWEQCLLQRQRWWSECLQWSHWTPPETEREGEGGGGVSPSSGPRLQDTLDKFSREKTWCSSGRGKSHQARVSWRLTFSVRFIGRSKPISRKQTQKSASLLLYEGERERVANLVFSVAHILSEYRVLWCSLHHFFYLVISGLKCKQVESSLLSRAYFGVGQLCWK